MDSSVPPDAPAPLGPAEVRALGCLVEKDITTPDNYPLTLNALTNACNQISNREPVISLAEQDVVLALDALRRRGLAYEFQGAESRVPKYGHRLAESLGLARPETAALCVLMLRGPQTVGEVRARTARMHEFAGLAEAEAALEALCSRPQGALAARLPRRHGAREQRYAHLLGGPAQAEAPGPPPASAAPDERIARLEAEVRALRQEVAELRGELRGPAR